ncbi:hypothetical protein HZD82_25120, partial [Pantoea agglomerans]|uniref:hypothetical protein n=1 Tax=Enterobacter agglomerans TaxID=549 RepID=UPI001A8C6CB2
MEKIILAEGTPINTSVTIGYAWSQHGDTVESMEHIEQAGVHSGDSACSLPAYTLSQEIQNVMRQQVEKLAF